ncbi:MAG: hypothetical protein ABI254_05290 [Chthoniobacterales bacterium]
MQFLTSAECQAWCLERSVPLRNVGWIRPDIKAEHLHIVDIPYKADSGAKVHMARFLLSLVYSDAETLLWVDDWEVWPSSQHMPLFARFREALGEYRPLIEACGHLVSQTDMDDAISIIATSLLFIWDCYGISASGRNAFYFSHDEYCYFASRDESTAAQVRNQLIKK